MELQGQPRRERYAYVAKEILHLEGTTDEQLVEALVQDIRNINDTLNIPQASRTTPTAASRPTTTPSL